MSWSALPENVRLAATATLTEKQLAVFKLELAGLSLRQIGRHLDIARATALDHTEAAHRNLLRAGVRQDGSGKWIIDTKEAA